MKKLAVVLSALSLLAFVCGSASARVAVVETDPINGETLVRAPATVTLQFDGMIQPALTRLFLSISGGHAFGLPAQPKLSAPTDRLTVIMPLLHRGSYILRYRVVDTGGEETFGSVSFSAGGY